MKVSEQIRKSTSSGVDSPRKFNKSFVASLLGVTRKTLYSKMADDRFDANELKLLRDNKIIN